MPHLSNASCKKQGLTSGQRCPTINSHISTLDGHLFRDRSTSSDYRTTLFRWSIILSIITRSPPRMSSSRTSSPTLMKSNKTRSSLSRWPSAWRCKPIGRLNQSNNSLSHSKKSSTCWKSSRSILPRHNQLPRFKSKKPHRLISFKVPSALMPRPRWLHLMIRSVRMLARF